MQIRIGYDLSFEAPQPTPMQLMLYVHPDQAPALRRPEWIVVEPATAVEGFLDSFGNRAARILAPTGLLRIRYDNVIDDSGRLDVPIEGLPLTPVHQMPAERVVSLRGGGGEREGGRWVPEPDPPPPPAPERPGAKGPRPRRRRRGPHDVARHGSPQASQRLGPPAPGRRLTRLLIAPLTPH